VPRWHVARRSANVLCVLRRFPFALVYLLSGLVLGPLYFTLLVTGWSVSLTVMILAALPVLLAFSLLVRACAAFERVLAAGLLGAAVGPPWRPDYQHGVVARLKAWITDWDAWREQVFLMARFVLGLALGTLAICAVGGALWLLAAPIVAPLIANGYDLGFWHIETVSEGLALVPVGVALAALSIPLIDGLGLGSRWLAESLLAPRGGETWAPPGTTREEARRMTLRRAGEAVHAALPLQAALSGILGGLMVALWLVTSHGYFWPAWVMLGFAILLGLQGVLAAVLAVRDPVRRGFVADAGIAGVLAATCVIVWALAGGGYFWPIWPLLGLGTLLALHAVIAFSGLWSRAEHERLTHRVEELTRTRAGAVHAEAEELRRIERDLHDGAQARLVALSMTLGLAEDKLDRHPGEARELLNEARGEARAAITELRNLARGIAPPILTDRGLTAALESLISSARVLPVTIEGDPGPRMPAAIETAAYFIATEALANAAKHAGANEGRIRLERQVHALVVEVSDDGRGGANPSGSGLLGLRRRVEALDGTLTIDSPSGGGTRIRAELPCEL
jgi:signal transduction histidine kinase